MSGASADHVSDSGDGVADESLGVAGSWIIGLSENPYKIGNDGPIKTIRKVLDAAVPVGQDEGNKLHCNLRFLVQAVMGCDADITKRIELVPWCKVDSTVGFATRQLPATNERVEFHVVVKPVTELLGELVDCEPVVRDLRVVVPGKTEGGSRFDLVAQVDRVDSGLLSIRLVTGDVR